MNLRDGIYPPPIYPPTSFKGEHFFKFSAIFHSVIICFVKPLKHLADRYNKRKMKKIKREIFLFFLAVVSAKKNGKILHTTNYRWISESRETARVTCRRALHSKLDNKKESRHFNFYSIRSSFKKGRSTRLNNR